MCNLVDPREFVSEYFDLNKITVDECGAVSDGNSGNRKTISSKLYLDYISMVTAYNAIEKTKAVKNTIKPIDTKIMNMAIEEYILIKQTEVKAVLLAEITKYIPNTQIMRDFVRAITGEEDEDTIAVMSHWIWQVKKKMLKQLPTYHIMPIFYGKQGGGKTMALNRFIGPIANFRLDIDMKEAADSKCFAAMEENYVIVFDEMQGAGKADIDALKKQVTTDFNNYRPLHTNYMLKSRQSCSFIGATNRPVGEQILDATGMRRFYEIHCLDSFDRAILEDIDYKALWQSIDPAKTDGYTIDRMDTIRTKQEKLVSEDEISLFMEAKGLTQGKAPTKRVFTSELFNVYKDWATEAGYRPMNVSNFGKKFGNKGFAKGVAKEGGKTHRYFEVNQDYTAPEAKPWENPLDQRILKAVK